jgi:hypothetical protein
VSSFDGAQPVRVDVEHLPGWRYRLWLGEPYPRADLGEVDRTHQLWPEAQRRVGEHLGLADGSYYAEFVVPRPAGLPDGARVQVPADDGRRLRGIVVAWAQGGVHVNADETGLGIYAPEEVTLLEERRAAPDELT